MSDASAKARGERPNVLWICTDQQRFDTIRALGNDRINTPNLDRLVESGVALTGAFSQSPVCTPSRAAMKTRLLKQAFDASVLTMDPMPPRLGAF